MAAGNVRDLFRVWKNAMRRQGRRLRIYFELRAEVTAAASLNEAQGVHPQSHLHDLWQNSSSWNGVYCEEDSLLYVYGSVNYPGKARQNAEQL